MLQYIDGYNGRVPPALMDELRLTLESACIISDIFTVNAVLLCRILRTKNILYIISLLCQPINVLYFLLGENSDHVILYEQERIYVWNYCWVGFILIINCYHVVQVFLSVWLNCCRKYLKMVDFIKLFFIFVCICYLVVYGMTNKSNYVKCTQQLQSKRAFSRVRFNALSV